MQKRAFDIGRQQFFNLLLILLLSLCHITYAQTYVNPRVETGADQTRQYFPLLYGKKVALAANQTSTIKEKHLADSMLNAGLQLQFVFCPEHGFRGVADAGEKVNNSIDAATGLRLISLYGKHKKPTAEDLAGIDIVVFDIQDVGVRFYTYISTLHYIMEACAENNIPLLVLDRPNPNGFYVDGPTLDTSARSFVGMHPVPLVHGMTIAEYALMINEEGWLNNGIRCELMVVPCRNYSHTVYYVLPIKPSPNLPNARAIYLYPSLGLFEGTVMSVGRGTDFPFQVYGHPDYKKTAFSFTPESTIGAQLPKYQGAICYGKDLRLVNIDSVKRIGFTLQYLIDAYKTMPNKTVFFNSFFYRLAGGNTLKQQIESGMTEAEIEATWQTDIERFKKVRKKYLLYPDFE